MKQKMATQLSIQTALNDVIQQILTAAPNYAELVLIGILPQGQPLAKRIAKQLQEKTGHSILTGTLDVTLYRDDLPDRHEFVTLENSEIPFSLKNKHVILIQDIMRGGVRARAALNALLDYERPKKIELATLFDLGQRFLPITAQYCGHQLDENTPYDIRLALYEIDGEDKVLLP